ncbi:MAG: hypothetical protein Q4C00_00435 [Bacillota bacterium]|nr:hypothetical protein [Bacillota bacterium]
MKKRLLYLGCLCLILSIFSAGCGKEDIIDQAINNAKDVESVTSNTRLETNYTVTVNDREKAVDLQSTVRKQYTKEPLATSMQMNMRTNNKTANIITYCVIEDGKLARYTNRNGQWQKETVSSYYETALSSGTPNNPTLYLEMSRDFTPDSENMTEDGDILKYTAVIPGENIEAMPEIFGDVKYLLDSLDIDSKDIRGLYKNAKDIEITFWLDKSTLLLIHYELDMLPFIRSVLTAAQAEDIIDQEKQYVIEKAFAASTLSYNNVEAIEVPDSVKGAANIGK